MKKETKNEKKVVPHVKRIIPPQTGPNKLGNVKMKHLSNSFEALLKSKSKSKKGDKGPGKSSGKNKPQPPLTKQVLLTNLYVLIEYFCHGNERCLVQSVNPNVLQSKNGTCVGQLGQTSLPKAK